MMTVFEWEMTKVRVQDVSLEIAALHQAYAADLAPKAVVEEVLRRIDKARDPGIFLHLADKGDIEEQTQALGAFDPRTKPLWGVPFAVKDNIDCAGMPTTAACPAFAYTPDKDAYAVEKIRAAGGLLIGKTNLDQFATGLVGTRTPYPVPRNPHDPARIPGGSSSGSAVAVARGLVSFALGTDTAGSGRVPAGLNNIVGLKPSLGLVSTRGVVPACRTLDTVSIFTLTTCDAWHVLETIAGFDADDAFSRDLAKPTLVKPERPRIGIPAQESGHFFGDTDAEEAFDQARADLGALNVELVDLDFSPLFEVASLLYQGAWVAERYAAIAEFLEREPDALHRVTARIINSARALTAVDAFEGMYRLQALKREIAPIFHSIDALAVPTVPRFYSLDEVQADPIDTNSRLGTYTNFVNLLDLCGLAVPTRRRADGLPGGMTLLAPSGRDGALATLGDTIHVNSEVTLGATAWRLRKPLPEVPAEAGVKLAVVGAHMHGLPLNHQLTSRNGRFVATTATAPSYRLYDLAAEIPRKPGLLRVNEGGLSISLEVWEMDTQAFGEFVAQVPKPMSIGDITLADGTVVKGFLVEAAAVADARDISEFGGWRPFLDQRPMV